MSQAQGILRRLGLLLCGRSFRDETTHRTTSDNSVAGHPSPAVPLSQLTASMHQFNQHPAVASYQSAEDHDLNFALAQSVVDQVAWQAARGSGPAQQGNPLAAKRSAGETLSQKFWKDGSLGFNDVITDGFYDIYGDYPEVCEAPNEFPTLENLRKVRTGAGDVREVVLVDQERDHGLLEVVETLSDAMAEAKPQDTVARIQVVAKVVSDRFGGEYDSEASLEHFWQVSSATEKRRSRSAVVLLCRLEVGALRHRAVLFKVLADAVKLPCRLIRGQALCGAEGAANVVVAVGGQECVVDLVFEPGRLYSEQQFAGLVQMRRTRVDSWRQPPPLATATSGVERSGASASSLSSAGTLGGAGGSCNAVSSLAAASNEQAAAASAGPSTAAAPPPPPAHCSPRGMAPRPHVSVPPVPAPGTYSGPLPTGGALLGHSPGVGSGGSGGWPLGPGQPHGHNNPPAIAGSKLKFVITDLPKGVAPQSSHIARVEARNAAAAAAAPCGAATAPAASAPTPLPAPPSATAAGRSGAAASASTASAGSSTRHSGGSVPGKAKSMVDLATSQHTGGAGGAAGGGGGGHHPSASAGDDGGAGGDLIRLDSEPLPDSTILYIGLPETPGAGPPPPERSHTPTGHMGVSPRIPSGPPTSRRQNSLDQNGWVKFSGSFTRTGNDSRPPWSHVVAGVAGGGGGGMGPSPLGHASATATAGAAASGFGGSRLSSALTTAGPSTQQHQQQPHHPQPLELANSFTSLCTAPSPDGIAPTRSSAGSGAVSQPPGVVVTGSAPGSSTVGGGSGSGAAQASSLPGTALSSVTAASPFAHFKLPPGLSAQLTGCGGASGVSVGGEAAGEAAAASAVAGRTSTGPAAAGLSSTGGNGSSSLTAVPSRPSSQSPHLPHPPHAAPQPPPPPQQAQGTSMSAASPFHAMQLGFAANMPAAAMPALTAAFPTLPPQQQPQQQPNTAVGASTRTGAPSVRPASAQTGHISPGHVGPGGPLSLQTGPQQQPAMGGGVALPRMGSTGLGYPGHPQQQPQQPLRPQHPTRQLTGGSADSGPSRSFGHVNGLGFGAGGNTGAGGLYATPPPKGGGGMDGGGAGGGGSKAPSPSLSTPFTVHTASSVASATPPGSVPTDSVPFADLSPFNLGEAGGGGASGRKERDPAQFFADLSPFNTATGTSSGGSGGDARDPTPGRRTTASSLQQQQPIVELPTSNENSRDTTPRVSYTNFPDNGSQHGGGGRGGSASGPSSVGGGGGGTGAEYATLDLARMRLGGMYGNGRASDASNHGHHMAMVPAGVQAHAAHPYPQNLHHQQQHMQQQMQTFGGMTMAAAAAAAAMAQQQHPHTQQHPTPTPQQFAMAYYAAAMQGHPYGAYMHQQQQQPGMPPAQGYLPQGHGAPGGVPAWPQRPSFDPAWASTWAAQQQHQQHQYMMQAAYLQQQQQQQQQQQHSMAAAGLGGQGMATGGLERRTSIMHSTTTTTVVNTQIVEAAAGLGLGGGLGGGAPGGGVAMRPLRPQLPSTGPQLALPPAPQQQGAHPGVRLGSAQAGPAMRAPADLAHEMTVPSQQRLAAMASAAAAGRGGARSGGQAAASSQGGGPGTSDGGAGSQDASPLGLQPSVSAPLPPSYRDLEIDPQELKFGPRIGIGSYGEVYKGTWRGTEVAIKRFLEQNLSPITIREFRGEVMIMSKLRHPNIVLFMGAVTVSNQLAIVTQYVQRGSLFRLLHRTKIELDPRRRLNIALDIAKGMEYLHNCKPVLVHRDLKSPNLLVDKDWTVKVCDFGLTQVKMNTFLTAKSQGGSPAWMAPEILRGEPCDEKSDVFSFGVILYELVSGKEPWEDLNPMQVVGAVGFSGRRMDLPPDLDPEVTSLIQACWANSPRDRPSFTQILATMTAWSALRPTAAVMQQQEAAARARQQGQGARGAPPHG